MNYDFSILIYVRFLSALIAICLAYIIWKKKLSNGANYLASFELAAGIWAIFDGLGAASNNVELKLMWAQLAYIGITSSGVFFLLFSLVYTEKARLVNYKTITLLFLIPLITLIIAFTNPYHKFLWTEIIIIEKGHQSVFYYGFWFWIHVFYEYFTLTSGIILLLIHGFRVYRLYRINIGLLLFGSILPFIASILYVFKLTPVKGLDLTPISFIFTGIVIAISLFRLRMFDIMPIVHKQVIDSLRVGMLVIDSRDRIVDSNPVFDKISESSCKKSVGCLAHEILSKINIHLSDFTEENGFTIEIQISPDGEQKYFEVNYQEVNDHGKRLICKIITLNDVTTKKLILNAIAESNNNRKTELIEKEKLILDLNAYAHTVAHDLKNPINSIVGFSGVIKTRLLENNQDRAIELLEILQNESLKMSRIIDELLKLSTIRKEDIRPVTVSTGKILEEAFFRLDKQIIESKAVISMSTDWPEVLGYAQWLEEVWVNLLSNAIKYGGSPPEINLSYEKGPPGSYRFFVKDNGNGLPANSFGKIFEDFERMGRKDIEGHGFGLSIVKRIVEKLGGTVTVESKNIPGEGCVFSFTLPSCPA